MELNEQDLDLLDAYEADLLPEADRRKFEQKMKDDPEFGLAIRQMLTLHRKLRAGTDAKLRQFLEAKQLQHRKKTKFAKSFRRMAAVAAVGLIGAVFIWQISGGGNNFIRQGDKVEELSDSLRYAAISNQTFIHFPAPSTMSVGQSNSTESGIDLYKSKKYAEAIPLLEHAFQAKGDIKLQFFMGIACVGAQIPDKAIIALEACRKDSLDIIPQQDNDWYLLLAYIQKYNPIKIVENLDKILNDNSHKYYDQAKKLQKNLLEIKKTGLGMVTFFCFKHY